MATALMIVTAFLAGMWAGPRVSSARWWVSWTWHKVLGHHR